MNRVFDGKKPTKLGTEKRPALITVQTDEKKEELEAILKENNWSGDITVDAEKPENITDLELLQNPIAPTSVSPKTGRNDPCPCNSGKKYKKCCGK